MRDEHVAAAAKVAPALGGTIAANSTDMTWGDWAAVATILYIALQAFFLLRKELRKRGAKP